MTRPAGSHPKSCLVNKNGVRRRNKHEEKAAHNQVGSKKLPVQKVDMANYHIHYRIEGNTKNCSQRYEQWEGVRNAKINAKVENEPKDRASTDIAPGDIL